VNAKCRDKVLSDGISVVKFRWTFSAKISHRAVTWNSGGDPTVPYHRVATPSVFGKATFAVITG
jgi:hypothetical protein